MGQQRVIEGAVVGNKMDKTVVVAVERRKPHRLYHKIVTHTQRFKAHDEDNRCNLGDIVRIEECRPLSKDKRWRVVQILTQGDVAEIQPDVIGRELEETAQAAAKTTAAREAEEEAEAAETGDAETEDETEESEE